MVSSPFLRERHPGPGAATPRRPEVADLTDGELTAAVTSSLARCSGAGDADDWFPVAARPERARAEAARALALCAVCPVRPQCLELSMRVWHGGGQYGVWGGLIAADRAEAYRRWRAGVPVQALLDSSGLDSSGLDGPA